MGRRLGVWDELVSAIVFEHDIEVVMFSELGALCFRGEEGATPIFSLIEKISFLTCSTNNGNCRLSIKGYSG